MVLQEGWLRGWVWGHDVIFTYGPWGFVLTYLYHPGTFAAGIFIQCVFIATAAVAFANSRAEDNRLGWKATFALLIVASSMFDAASRSAELLPLVLLWQSLLLAAREHRGRVSRLGLWLAVLAGFLSLTKFTLCITALIVVATWDILAVRSRRKPFYLATYVTSVVLFWIAAFQPLTALPAFFRNALEIAVGFREMSVPGPSLPVFAYFRERMRAAASR